MMSQPNDTPSTDEMTRTHRTQQRLARRQVSTITVGFTKVGWHNWPGAPDHRAYLRHPHRHKFGVHITVEVHHHDRDIEFHDLLDWAQEAWHTTIDPVGDGMLGARSCEMIALELGNTLFSRYNVPVLRVTVTEDDEVAGTVEWVGK